MDDTEFTEFEDRVYLNPTTSRDEQLAFIDTLRETQKQNTAQINADTYALGSQLPSNLGGLSGAEDTFIARYQTPQTEATVADLRTAAQQSALNTALSNLQNAYKQRYNAAVLNYQKRAAQPTTPTTTPETPEDDTLLNTPNTETPEVGVRSSTLVERLRNQFADSIAETETGIQGALDAINSGDTAKAQSIPVIIRKTADSGSAGKSTAVVYRNNRGAVTGMLLNGKQYGAEEALNELTRLAGEGRAYSTTGDKYSASSFQGTAPLTTRPMSSNRGGRVNTLRK